MSTPKNMPRKAAPRGTDELRTIEHVSADDVIESAKKLLARNGYVVLKQKSYQQAQERHRVSEALRTAAEEHVTHIQRWAETELHNEIRELQARCQFLYGEARARGATTEELRDGIRVVGINCPNGHQCAPRDVPKRCPWCGIIEKFCIDHPCPGRRNSTPKEVNPCPI